MILTNPDLIERPALLAPLATRMVALLEEQVNEADPRRSVAFQLSRCLCQDPVMRLHVLASDADIYPAMVYGFSLAQLCQEGGSRWVFVQGTYVDPGVNAGDEVRQILHDLDQWAQAAGASKIMMATTRSAAAWARKYGFNEARKVMHRDVPAKDVSAA